MCLLTEMEQSKSGFPFQQHSSQPGYQTTFPEVTPDTSWGSSSPANRIPMTFQYFPQWQYPLKAGLKAPWLSQDIN